jgi:thiol-disulfide isomerase/thioredoxin
MKPHTLSAFAGRRQWLSAVLALGAAAWAGPVLAQSAVEGAAPIPPIGAPIALPDALALDGSALPASRWKGKAVVIELWASWCPFCARQNPLLDSLHRRYAPQGLEVLTLSIDRRPEDALKYLRERGYVFHAAMFDARWRAALGQSRGIPFVWVIGRDGKLAYTEAREMFPEDVNDLARFLRAGPG